MMLPTHATARLPFGAPASPLHDPALSDPELAARTAVGHSCKRTGMGMVASENNAESSGQDFAPVGDEN
jgi:hypothetical protein